VIQDDAGHGDASQGVGHIDSGVGEVAGFIHNLSVLLLHASLPRCRSYSHTGLQNYA
jgi:hypothetical protein